MDLHAILLEYWPHIVFVVSLAAGAGAAVHAAMTKQDVRSAIGWVGLTLLSPLFGALIYVVAGINRIRKTRSQQRDEAMLEDAAQVETAPVDVAPISGSQFASLKVLGDQSAVSGCWGNAVPLPAGGDEAYPAMLQAIRDASHAVAMQSYIFDNDPIGREMAQALIEAHERGVQVRVLIDAIGSRYSRPPIVRMLRARRRAGGALHDQSAGRAAHALRQPAQPPQDTGGGRAGGLHRRHERAPPSSPRCPARTPMPTRISVWKAPSSRS